MVLLLLIHGLLLHLLFFVEEGDVFMLLSAVFSVLPCFAIISLAKRERAASPVKL